MPDDSRLATPDLMSPEGEETLNDAGFFTGLDQADAFGSNGGSGNSNGGGGASVPTKGRGPGRPAGSGRPMTYKKAGKTENSEELTDAVAAAGVNLRDEEEAMSGQLGLGVSRRQYNPNHFLKPQQLAWFMEKTLEQQGMPTMEFDADLINLMSTACETYMQSIVADSVVMSQHRRRGIKTKKKQSLQNSKSNVSRALKEIAVKQKMREEKRVQRRIQLGLEEQKKDSVQEEQTQTNMTASLMMTGSRKKRYSWMQTPTTSNVLSSRGDNGIRYREAREEPGIVMRDLLTAVDNRRMGVTKAKVKGYAKLKD